MLWIEFSPTQKQYCCTMDSMMGYGYGSQAYGVGELGFLTWLVILIDLTLLGIWLWQKISHK